MHESLRLRTVQSPVIPVIADMIQRYPGTISLGQGVVNYGPPAAALEQISRFLAESANHKYQSVVGLPELRDAIAVKLAAENAVRISGDNPVIVTARGN